MYSIEHYIIKHVCIAPQVSRPILSKIFHKIKKVLSINELLGVKELKTLSRSPKLQTDQCACTQHLQGDGS